MELDQQQWVNKLTVCSLDFPVCSAYIWYGLSHQEMTFIQKDLQDETANIIVYKNIFLLLLQVVTLQGFLILLFDNSGFVIENELINKGVKKIN